MASAADIERIRGSLDTSQIKHWRSIITLIVFILTNIIVLIPFTIPIHVPRLLLRAISKALESLCIAAPKSDSRSNGSSAFVRVNVPMNFVTAPLIANLFLLAILAIGRTEVHDGIIGANNIAPYDIMLFFVSLAYIAISIDASGLIRYMAYRVLKSGGNAGYRLYLSLYTFFFVLTAGIGNDPIILSGTPFLAYMTRVSANIAHPRAWIYAQFAVANIASAILVSSNPTNLVIAGAFSIKFINYSANIVVPTVVTGIVLFPALVYVVFRDESLVPKRIEMHQLSEEEQGRKPVNPNVPKAITESTGVNAEDPPEKVLPLNEIMNPYLDKVGATVAASILAITLITLLVIHAFWITSPAAIVTFCFDIVWGWMNRHESRQIATEHRTNTGMVSSAVPGDDEEKHAAGRTTSSPTAEPTAQPITQLQERRTLSSIVAARWNWFHITFPTAATVLTHLPIALIPFAFCMFILVQALVTKGWVPVFAYGWDAWVNKTGTVGAIGGMGFISVLLCNVTWQDIHTMNDTAISNRTFWATVYSMVIGINYGAFSVAFSASLAGLLWRDILQRKFIYVRSRDFVRYNLPIIAIAMVVGCTVLIGQVYIVRDDSRYDA
ncbi:hypothetical protein DM02DRAFT_621039 [Periconia macrospinosa]|uniref:Citrate transporter-like domain-containing protein n=1 Tax=Periconia macrospinosa TaxID=97972 RepID=A0A2V1CXD6_9PLEO|nr:hypothetical protein DM02DRAFT_621039 [Periconia macrospinosa]